PSGVDRGRCAPCRVSPVPRFDVPRLFYGTGPHRGRTPLEHRPVGAVRILTSNPDAHPNRKAPPPAWGKWGFAKTSPSLRRLGLAGLHGGEVPAGVVQDVPGLPGAVVRLDADEDVPGLELLREEAGVLVREVRADEGAHDGAPGAAAQQ